MIMPGSYTFVQCTYFQPRKLFQNFAAAPAHYFQSRGVRTKFDLQRSIIIRRYNHTPVIYWLKSLFANLIYFKSDPMFEYLSRNLVLLWWNMFRKISTYVKFISSDKATRFFEISTLLLKALHRTKVRWRFCKILWPSQNIWSLT